MARAPGPGRGAWDAGAGPRPLVGHVDEHHEDVVLRLEPPAPGLLPPYDLQRQFDVLRGLECTAVRTNNPVCGAFRGFGANQAQFAMEGVMDRLAQLDGIAVANREVAEAARLLAVQASARGDELRLVADRVEEKVDDLAGRLEACGQCTPIQRQRGTP